MNQSKTPTENKLLQNNRKKTLSPTKIKEGKIIREKSGKSNYGKEMER